MKLERLPYQPGSLLEFYEESLSALGAVCERTWHDRLEVLAEGKAASLWNDDGAMHTAELHFVPADATAARDAQREIFPGSPLTFRLAEIIIPSPITLDRVVLANDAAHGAPDLGVAEKLWRNQFPDTHRWRSVKPFLADWNFSLLALIRCEIQAIDQHWSLHRLAIGIVDGELDNHLADAITFGSVHPSPPADLPWPVPDPARWSQLLDRALTLDLADQLAPIRARQENTLRRELERVNDYFDGYARELEERAQRTASEGVKLKTADRLAAAKAEHARRHADQVTRHEIHVHPHFEAFLFIAEPAWRAELHVERAHQTENRSALFIPRLRRWKI